MFEEFDTIYVIFAIALVYFGAYQFMLSKLVDKKRIKHIQDESKRLQKELSVATKQKDEKRLLEINKEYEAFLPKMMEMSFMQLKPLIIIIPALAILTPFLYDNFRGFEIVFPFHLPVFVQSFHFLFSFDFAGFFADFPHWRDTFGPVGWFWICVFVVSISLSLIRGAYNKIKGAIDAKTKSADATVIANNFDVDSSAKPELNTGLVEDKKTV
jgi:uncharacterized membrane protein (DUF106 family)